MSFWQDWHIKKFFIFLFVFIFSLFLAGIEIYITMTENAKGMFLSHDSSVATSLLNQGISEDVIATALNSNEESKEGNNLVTKIGLTQHTNVRLYPLLFQFQKKNIHIMIKYGLL